MSMTTRAEAGTAVGAGAKAGAVRAGTGRWAGMSATDRRNKIVTHLLLLLTIAVVAFPLYYAFVVSSHTMADATARPPKLLPGGEILNNYAEAWERTNMGRLLLNSTLVSLGITFGKIIISVLSAFAIVYFRFPFRQLIFWMIFVTLMLPVEVRMVPTYEVISDLGWIDSYTGLIIPLIASATATFLLRQFFMTVPKELAEAAQLDGASPLRFLWSILLPLSWQNLAALFVVHFVYGWKQYLWPLMMTTSRNMQVVVIGIQRLIPSGTQLPEWHLVMAAAIMALLPPVVVIIVMQRYFVKALMDSEK